MQMSASGQDAEAFVGVSPTANPPHPQVVSQIAHDLARLAADPASGAHLESVRAAIRTHGLAAFFDAARQTVSDGQPLASGSAVAFAAPTAAPALLPPWFRDDGLVRQTWTDNIGNRVSHPLRVFRPSTLDELRSILR